MRVFVSLVKVVLALSLVAALGGGAFYYKTHVTEKSSVVLRTISLGRSDLRSTISATGTLEPEEVVNVGSQVSGRVVKFGSDAHDPKKLVDYGSVVQQGDLLAEIDPVTYDIALEQAKATLEQSEANLQEGEAKLKQAEREWRRAQLLMPKKAVSESDFDTAQYNFESATANVALSKATVHQHKAAVTMAEVNRSYCTIASPVRGTIIDRRVNVGQTVAASLSAPSLFLIAKDLTKMQVWASVNEADIGQVRVGMPVQFTVDAFPGETFHGVVTQRRMNAQMTQNVVTYMVIVTTDNSDGRLLPYLTASVQFEVEKKQNVLVVPNAALGWEPETDQIDPSVDQTALTSKSTKTQHGRVWVAIDAEHVRPVDVTVGISDGARSEIRGTDVKEGMPVVVGEGESSKPGTPQTASSDSDQTSNPFLPKMPKGRRPPPGPM
ncbi:MAG: efflux RND transporter periplasmic adaptor subunit [Thermoguttaceae bacterium]